MSNPDDPIKVVIVNQYRNGDGSRYALINDYHVDAEPDAVIEILEVLDLPFEIDEVDDFDENLFDPHTGCEDKLDEIEAEDSDTWY